MTIQFYIYCSTKSIIVSDKDALEACFDFSNEYRHLVEPACGAALSLVYNPLYKSKYCNQYKNVVVIVCGGSAVSIDLLQKWKEQLILL